VFIIPYWRQTHVFKHCDFSYAIELINFIITLNSAINSLFNFPVGYQFEGRSAANSYHFYYSVFITSHYSRFRNLYHCLRYPIFVFFPQLLLLSLRTHIPVMSIIVTLSLHNQVCSHLWYHFFKTSYITSVCIPYPRHCKINRMFITIIIIIIIIFLHGLGRLTCPGIDALPSFPGTPTISSSSRFVVQGVFRNLVLSIISRWLIQFCLYLALTSCIPEISSSFHITSLLILSRLVYPLTLLRKRISAAI
jgi:hypothetical protein